MKLSYIYYWCALFSKFLGLNAVLVELDELSSGVPSFFKSDHGKLLRIAILCLVSWCMRHGLVITTRDCIQDTLSSRAALGRVRRASKGILHTRPETVRAEILCVTSSESCVLEYSTLTVSRCFY